MYSEELAGSNDDPFETLTTTVDHRLLTLIMGK